MRLLSVLNGWWRQSIYCLEAVLDGGGQYTTMLGHSHIIHLATDGQLIHLRIDYRHEHLYQKGTV